ncbi:MAG: tRNA (adenosine(37)-N6)-threonylcarbamoyltransferase complex ATPase subunit type 1 TsaE [Acidipila sp.]|nr:tRNA (adenosine(37)-N6)-threonylcarbamoyltransferase complex ATPase subunit type 1 TsaE [Acidipila sp.]
MITHDADHTIRAGREIAKELTAPLLILLSGELGAGKTTLAKGLISGLGAAPEDEVTSPTFTLVHEFRGAPPASIVVYHIDLYRIDGPADMATLGLEDIFLAPAVILVEWSEKWRMPSDWPVLKISLAVGDDHTRTITLC